MNTRIANQQPATVHPAFFGFNLFQHLSTYSLSTIRHLGSHAVLFLSPIAFILPNPGQQVMVFHRISCRIPQESNEHPRRTLEASSGIQDLTWMLSLGQNWEGLQHNRHLGGRKWMIALQHGNYELVIIIYIYIYVCVCFHVPDFSNHI